MISKRYARALLQYAVGKKAEDTVFLEMKKLAATFAEEPKLRIAMENPMLSKDSKLKLVLAALDNKGSEESRRFVQFVFDKKREQHFRYIALGYIDLYCEYKNINKARLITAIEPSEATVDKMKSLTQKIKSGTLDFETVVNPDIGGGFVLYVDTYRLDASIKTQLAKIKKDLVNENSKLS